MKILMTSDLHSDLKAIISFTENLVNYDCGIIAGDIMQEMGPSYEFYELGFFNNTIGTTRKDRTIKAQNRKKEQIIKDILCKAKKPIFIVRGNHDPIEVEWNDYRYIINIHNRRAEFGGYNFVGLGLNKLPTGGYETIKKSIELLKTLVDEKTILVTHANPDITINENNSYGHRGSKELLELSTKAKAHVFGHAHPQAGYKGKYINVAFPYYRKFYTITT